MSILPQQVQDINDESLPLSSQIEPGKMSSSSTATGAATSESDVSAAVATAMATKIVSDMLSTITSKATQASQEGTAIAANPTARASILKRIRRELVKIVDIREYSRPNGDQIVPRLRTNLEFFRLTYGTICLAVIVLVILSNPVVFVSLGVTLGLWYLLFIVRDPDEVLTIRGYEIKKKDKLTVLVPATILIIVFGGLVSTFFYIIFVAAIICGGHAVLHNKVEPDPLDELANEGEESAQIPMPIV